VYRPPGTDLELFESKLPNFLEALQSANKADIYLAGDWNID